jgi:O-antigen polymerase
MQLPVINNLRPLIYKLLLFLVIFSALLKSSLYVNAFYTHLFAYTIAGCIIIITAGFCLLSKSSISATPLSLVMLMLLGLWAAYIFCSDWFISTAGRGGTLQSYYLAISLITCFAIVLLLKTSSQNIRYLFLFILSAATIQVGISLLQSTGAVTTENAFFKVTGTWLNPNIAAMYIALAFPIVLCHVFVTYKYRSINILLLALMLLALLLLKSRTAILGVLLITLIILNWRYALLGYLFKKSGKNISVIMLTAAIVTIVLAGYLTYNIKRESAESRKFIWKTGLSMIVQKPLTGYGYGTFERNYNLFQAAIFSTNSAAPLDVQNAAHTNMGYNEFLQSAIEGGITGAAFLMLFLFLLLRSAFLFLKRNNALHYQKGHVLNNNSSSKHYLLVAATGIAGLCFMSLVNFTLLAVPVMSIFILYAAIIIYATSQSGTISINKIVIKIAGGSLIVTGLLLGISTVNTARSQHTIRKAVNLAHDKNYSEAITTLEEVAENNRANPDYYQTLGNCNYFYGNKAAALAAYTQAAAYTSTPELYQQMGNCYAEKKQYNEAMVNYEMAKYIQPNRITPRYLLMGIYVKLRDSANSLRLAKEILSMEEKVPSPQINIYKRTATDIIKKLQQKNSL